MTISLCRKAVADYLYIMSYEKAEEHDLHTYRLPGIVVPDEWWCSECGSFHKYPVKINGKWKYP